MDDMVRDRHGLGGPILSDGTHVRSLVDLNKFEVAMRTLNDPEIHRMELKKIFARSWLGVALEAEIPNPGDYVKRSMGEDQVIVTRGRDGEVSILLNACSHRGMEICWAERGNQANFKCPYHGWVFDHSGNLLGAPFEKEMYGDWDKSQYGLRKARVAIRHGFIFGTFGEDTPSLEEWMGDFLWYFDMCMSGLPEMAALSPRGRMALNTNWKTLSDQLSGDGYHTLTTHRSLFDIGYQVSDVDSYWINNVKVSFPEGHAVFSFNPMTTPSLAPDGTINSGRPMDDALLDSDNRYAFDATGGRTWFLHMFPATILLGTSSDLPGGGKMAFASVMGLRLLGQGKIEQWGAMAMAKAMVESMGEMLKRPNPQAAIGMLVGIDDNEQWPGVQRAARGFLGQEQPMRYFAQLGINKPKNWPGPGNVHAGFSKDDGQWSFWKRWLQMMISD